MKIEISEINGNKITEIISDKILIRKTQDALDIMAESNYRSSWKIIMYEKNIISDFFDLKTGIAGEILQKFSTYNVQLAIVGDFTKYPGNSLKDFIFESNRLGRINFVNSTSEAKEKLSK
jgi:hypothetical protein